jgi:hypothetical protein
MDNFDVILPFEKIPTKQQQSGEFHEKKAEGGSR